MVHYKDYPSVCYLGGLKNTQEHEDYANGKDARVKSLTPNRGCILDNTNSITQHFYGPYYSHNMTCDLLSADVVNAKKRDLYDIVLANDHTNLKTGYMSFFVGKDTRAFGKTNFTRSLVPLGAPLDIKGLSASELSNPGIVERHLTRILWKHYGQGGLTDKYFYELLGVDHNHWLATFLGLDFQLRSGLRRPFPVVDDLEVHLTSGALDNHVEKQRQDASDDKYFIFAMSMVFGFIWFYTDSLFVGIVGMGNILLCVPTAGAVWTGILRINYFPQTMVFILFVMLGIGADNLFVFYDGFKQARSIIPRELFFMGHGGRSIGAGSSGDLTDIVTKDLEVQLMLARIRLAYDRALAAIFNTSLTTSVAFISVGMSDVPFLSGMGYFAADCIMTMYVMAMISYPPLLMLHFRNGNGNNADAAASRNSWLDCSKGYYWRRNWCCCCFWRMPFENEEQEAQHEANKFGAEVPVERRGESTFFLSVYALMTRFFTVIGGDKDTATTATPAKAGGTKSNSNEADACKVSSKDASGKPLDRPSNVSNADSDASAVERMSKYLEHIEKSEAKIAASPRPSTMSASGIVKPKGVPTVANTDVENDDDDVSKVKLYYVPIVLVVVLQSLAFFGAYQYSLMGSPEDLSPGKPHDHSNTLMMQSRRKYLAAGADNLVGVAVTFGIEDVDRSKFWKLDPQNNRGDPIFYHKFDVYDDVNAAVRFVEFCDKLDAKTCSGVGGELVTDVCKDKLPGNKFIDSATLSCPLKAFFIHHGIDVSPGVGANYAGIHSGFKSNDCCSTRDKFMTSLRKFRFEQTPAYSRASWKNLIGFTDKDGRIELRWLSVSFKHALARYEGYGPRYEMVKEVEKVIDDYSTPKTVTFSDENMLHLTDTPELQPEAGDRSHANLGPATAQEATIWWLFTGCETAIGVAMDWSTTVTFPAAFLVLLLSTGNARLAIFATLTIADIVYMVLGTLKFVFDKEQDLIVVFVCVISLGFSCDYVLHLGHMFVEATHMGIQRADLRIRYAMARIGSTIIAAAITTMAAGVALFMAESTFLYYIGFVIVYTIMLSFVYTFGLFVSLNLIPYIGVSGDAGFLPGYMARGHKKQEKRLSTLSDTIKRKLSHHGNRKLSGVSAGGIPIQNENFDVTVHNDGLTSSQTGKTNLYK
jgi:hypothetical protein